MEVFVSRHGQHYGPYSEEELSQELNAGTFAPGDSVSTDDGKSWVKIRALPGIAIKPFVVRLDEPANRLVICYRGRVGQTEVERCAQEVRLALQKLSPGFHLLADFTDLEFMDVKCAPDIVRIMDDCNAAGVTAVARVIPDQRRDIGLQIMSFFHYRPEVQIVTCASVDEAQRALREFVPPSFS